MSKKTSKKPQRTDDELIAEHEEKIALIKQRKRKRELEKALEDGKLSEDDQKRFKILRGKVTTLAKAMAIIDEYEDSDKALEEMRDIVKTLEGKMRAMLKKDDDKPVEKSGEGSGEEEYEDED